MATELIAGSEREGIAVIDGRAHELYRGNTIPKSTGDTWDDGSGHAYVATANGDETTWCEVE